MSPRGQKLFDAYVDGYLNHPHLAGLSLETHTYSLISQAREESVPAQEIIDEVGPLRQALGRAMISETNSKE